MTNFGMPVGPLTDSQERWLNFLSAAFKGFFIYAPAIMFWWNWFNG